MLRWLLVGIGDIATKRVIPAIQEEPRSRLVAIVTRDPEKAAHYQVPAFPNLENALQHGGFEAVYVATPVFLHASQTVEALGAGMHVLCEKPMAMNFPQAQVMVEEAERSGRCLGIAYYRRCYPKVHRAMELIRQGAIGQPVMAYATCHSPIPADGLNRSWLLDPAQAGGGPLYDVASHRIDLLNYFFGQPHFFSQPQEVRACLSNAVHQMAVEDSATLLIKYQNGLHAVVDVRWNSEIARDEFRIIGTQGEMDLTPLNGPRLVYPGGSENLPTHPNLHFPCIQKFVEGVLDGKELVSSGATALATDWVTEQAVKSARRDRTLP